MSATRIISVITDEGTSTRDGLDAETHLKKLPIKRVEDTSFTDEVKRKLVKDKKD